MHSYHRHHLADVWQHDHLVALAHFVAPLDGRGRIARAGADGVDYSKKALTELGRIKDLGLDHLPICMAKTQKSFSDNDALLGRPMGFTVNVREFEFAAGAGFIIPILGKMMRMPGLPAVPASEGMEIDNDGKISGLS